MFRFVQLLPHFIMQKSLPAPLEEYSYLVLLGFLFRLACGSTEGHVRGALIQRARVLEYGALGFFDLGIEARGWVVLLDFPYVW